MDSMEEKMKRQINILLTLNSHFMPRRNIFPPITINTRRSALQRLKRNPNAMRQDQKKN